MKSKLVFITTVLALLVFAVGAAGAEGPRVVASTAWTAAYARAAGAGDITVIAPLELKHPPEYEIKPSDLEKVRGAKLVVYAGYEKFAQKLAETAGGDKVEVLTVNTDNPPDNVKQQARLIAERLGTMPAYDKWAKTFDSLTAQLRADVLKAYPDRKVVVHAYQRTFVEWLGLEILGEFGPAEPSPAVLADLAKKGAVVVIDNYHNPCGQPIAESARARYVQFINFPGKDGTTTIEDLYRYNTGALLTAAGKTAAQDSVDWLPVVAVVLVAAILAGAGWMLRRRT